MDLVLILTEEKEPCQNQREKQNNLRVGNLFFTGCVLLSSTVLFIDFLFTVLILSILFPLSNLYPILDPSIKIVEVSSSRDDEEFDKQEFDNLVPGTLKTF